MFKKILVPIDGSRNSYRALKYAVDIAKKYDARITLIHVFEQSDYGYVGIYETSNPANFVTNVGQAGKKLLSRRKTELAKQGIDVETLLVRGTPSDEILTRSEDYDLVVIGSRGLGGVKERLLGGVSSKVVLHSDVPILVIKPSGPNEV